MSIESWIEGYRQAWESNDPEHIRALFTPDAEYRTEPSAEPWRGQQEIVTRWLENRDEAGSTNFRWWLLAESGGTAVVQGATEYIGRTRYDNLWVIRLERDGRASEFTEWWTERPNPGP